MTTPIISDETLFAYVDNALDASERARVEAAMAADPKLAQRVEQQRSLRTLLGAAYRPVLEEALPNRQADAVTAPIERPAKAKVLDITAARAKNKSKPRGDAEPATPPASRWWRAPWLRSPWTRW